MSSITGDAEPCRPSSQGEGWPVAANAAPPTAKRAKLMVTKAINRLSTSISFALLDEKTALDKAPFLAPSGRPPRADERLGPAWHGSLPRAWQDERCSGTEPLIRPWWTAR